jgi:hypothetical protein
VPGRGNPRKGLTNPDDKGTRTRQPTPHAPTAERAILHDDDAGRALRDLSHECRLLVVSSATGTTGSRVLGETVVSLIGRIACPLAVVLPPAPTPEKPWWTGAAWTRETP